MKIPDSYDKCKSGFQDEASDALRDEMNDIWLENQTRSLRKSGRNLYPIYGLHALLMNL